MRVRIDTREYELSRMRKPRGRDVWWFTVKVDGQDVGEFLRNGTYTWAKQSVIARLREKHPGADEAVIVVMP